MVDKSGASFRRPGPSRPPDTQAQGKSGGPDAKTVPTPSLPTLPPRQPGPQPVEGKPLGAASQPAPTEAAVLSAARSTAGAGSAERTVQILRALTLQRGARTDPERLRQTVEQIVKLSAGKSLEQAEEVCAMVAGLCEGLAEEGSDFMSDKNLAALLDALFAKAGSLQPGWLAIMVAQVVIALREEAIKPARLSIVLDRAMAAGQGAATGKDLAHVIARLGQVLGGRQISNLHDTLLFDAIARSGADEEVLFWALGAHLGIHLDDATQGQTLDCIRAHFAHLGRVGPTMTESLARVALAPLAPVVDPQGASTAQREALLGAVLDGIEALAPHLEAGRAQQLLEGFVVSLKVSDPVRPRARALILERITGLLPRLPPEHAAAMACGLITLFSRGPVKGKPGWPEYLAAVVTAMAQLPDRDRAPLARTMVVSLAVTQADSEPAGARLEQMFGIARNRALDAARQAGSALDTRPLETARMLAAAQMHWLLRPKGSAPESKASASETGHGPPPLVKPWIDAVRKLYSDWVAAGQVPVAHAPHRLVRERLEQQIEALESEMAVLSEIMPGQVAAAMSAELFLPIGELIDRSSQLARKEDLAKEGKAGGSRMG